MKRILLLLNGAALLGAIAWLATSPSWEPSIAILTLLATLIGVATMKTNPPGEETRESAGSSNPSSPSSTINITGNNAVVSSNQSGGITAQTVLIQHGATTSGARLVLLDTPKQALQPDGRYLTTAPFMLETSFPVGNLKIEVHGETIQEMDFTPARTGAFISGHSGNRQGFSFPNIPNASGKYWLKVRSSKAEQFSVDYAVE